MKNNLTNFVVLYHAANCPAGVNVPSAMLVKSFCDDAAAATCDVAHPGADVVWVVETDNFDVAYADYYGENIEEETLPRDPFEKDD